MNEVSKTAARPQNRKVRIGRVVSNRMQKTIVVQVERLVGHRLYERVVHRASRFKVHDETNQAKLGDWVKIMETRPLSKEKRWRLVEIVKRGEAQDLAASQPAGPPEAAG